MNGGGGALGRAGLYALSALFALTAFAAGAALLLPAPSDHGAEDVQAASTEEPPESDARDAAGSGDDSGALDGHIHQWKVSETVRHVPEESHVETVEVPGRDIVENHTVCDACGAHIDTEDAMAAHFQENPSHAKAGYTEGVPTVVGREAGGSDRVVVVDEAAHDEFVTTKTCTLCGATEQETGL